MKINSLIRFFLFALRKNNTLKQQYKNLSFYRHHVFALEEAHGR